MKTFTLTGASALSPAQLREGLLDPTTWRRQDATIEMGGGDELTATFPLSADAVPDALARFVPNRASLRMEVHADAEAPAGSPQTAHLTVTVPGAPVVVRVVLTVQPTAPASDAGAAQNEGTSSAQGTGSTVSAFAELESSVPIFGSMLESALEPVVRAQLREKFDKLVHLS